MKTNMLHCYCSNLTEAEREGAQVEAVLGSPGSKVWLGMGFWEVLRVIYL